MSLKSKIESLLFISNYPLTAKRLAELAEEKTDAVKKAIDELEKDYQERRDCGIILMRVDDKIQLGTHSGSAKEVRQFIKDETTGELTRASLETLTIIAYRGPVTRAEVEQIRGVNCAIILRNLLIRGLVEEKINKEKMETRYSVSLEFLKFLGVTGTDQLPDFQKLNSADRLQKILEEKIES